jgi:microcystin-dependent protein
MPTVAKAKSAKKPAKAPAKTPARKSAARSAALGVAVQPYLGQIDTFAFNFAPSGWQPCDGRLLQINQNRALYALLSNTYGGDGRLTFGVPRLAPVTPSGPNYFIAIEGSFPSRS